MRNYRNSRRVNRIIGWVMIISFLLGFFGFLHAICSGAYPIEDKDPLGKQKDSMLFVVLHALFDAVGQFFFNRDKGGYMNWAIFISQFTAPLSLIGGVMVVVVCFQSIIDRIRGRYRRMRHGSVIAVYGDGEEKAIVSRAQSGDKRNQTLVYPEDELFRLATDHVIYFRDDRHSIKFFEDNKAFFQKGKKVYMVFSQTDPFLFEREHGGNAFRNVQFVNINEIIAKDYWQEHDLLAYRKEGTMDVAIAILGFSDLARKLLHYGVILNCYELDQKVQYNIWGDTALYENALQDLDRKINDAEMKDRIIFRGDDLESAVSQLEGMDRIILTDECRAEYVQTIIRKYPDKDIHFVDPEGSSLNRLRGASVESYASRRDFDVNGIIREAEHAAGKQLNARYAMIYGDHILDREAYRKDPDEWKEKKWEELSPFLKESNDIAAEYHMIREKSLYDRQCDVLAEQLWNEREEAENSGESATAIIGLGTLGRKLLLRAAGSGVLEQNAPIYIAEKDYRKAEHALQAVRNAYPQIDVDERVCHLESIETERSEGLPRVPCVIRTDETQIPQIVEKTKGYDPGKVISAEESLQELAAQKALESIVSGEELCILEHVRWCRFHYMNGWEYASRSQMNGSRKDERHRLHSDLRRFDELKEIEQTKDLESVAVMLADPALRPENKVIDNTVRREIIRRLALERYGERASNFWDIYKETIIPDDGRKDINVRITGFDIAGVALAETFREKAGEEVRISFDCIGDREFLSLMGMGAAGTDSPVTMEIQLDGCDRENAAESNGNKAVWKRFLSREERDENTGERRTVKNDRLEGEMRK